MIISHPTAESFRSALIARAREMTEVQFRLVLMKIRLELLTRIVNRTPVDTGRARGNWQVTSGSPATGFDDDKKDDKGGATISDGFQKINNIPENEVVWITNNLPYINRLEEGWSGKSSEGMVKVSIEEVMTMFARPTTRGSN